MRNRRWSDNDKYFGPFTLAMKDSGHGWGFYLDSGHEESPGCHLRLHGFGGTLIINLPPIVRPSRRKVHANWDAATVERLGRNWYCDEHSREYGFNVTDGTLFLRYGPQTHDSLTDNCKCCFLPWTQWRFVRHSLYDLDGREFWREGGFSEWENSWDARKHCPSVTFEFDDFDGERIQARTTTEEREWLFGEGWFKWLSWFRKPMIRRSLDIEFSAETGPRKGSWKGGTVGHSINMLPGELHESAFRRYCEQNNMTFVGTVNG